MIDTVLDQAILMLPPSVPLSAIRQPAFLYGPDGRIATANDAAEALAGRPLAGLSPADVLRTFRHRRRDGTSPAPGELPACRALAGEEVMEDPFTVMLADGRTVDVLASASALREGGVVAGALVVWQDVTERVRAGAALQQAKEQTESDRQRLEAILETIPSAVIIVEAVELRLSYQNRRATELYGGFYLGCTVEQLVEQVRLLRPDRTPFPLGEMPGMRSLASGEAVRNEELILEPAGGAAIPVLVSAAPLRDAAGRITSTVITFDEITERKAAEERHSFLLHLSDALRSLEDAGAIQAAASGILGEHIAADRVLYGGVSPDGERITVEHGYARGVEGWTCSRSAVDFGACLVDALRTGRTVLVPDTACDDRIPDSARAAFAAAEVRSLAAVPLVKGGRLVAGLLVQQSAPRAWTPAEVELIEETAERTWAAVERARVEQALAEREQQLAQALEGAGAGMWVRAPDGGWIATPRLSALFGLPPGAPPLREEEFVALVHPDDLPAVREAWLAARDGRAGYDQEYRVVWPDGSVRWLASRGAVVADAGGVLRFMGITYDITGRKDVEAALAESEEQFRMLFEHSQDAILLTDPRGGGRVLSANPAARRMFGLTEEGFIGRDRNAMLNVDDSGVAEVLRQRVRAGTASTEFMYRRADGSTFPGELSSALFTDSRGEPRSVAIIRDITERKRAEEALKEYAERLAASNEELKRFAYVASHDLQEPLRSVVSFSQLLERRYRGQLDADADDYIGFIVDGGTRMQRLIQDLLQFSRVETMAGEPVPVDAGRAVMDALVTFNGAIREIGATVTVGPLPTVRTDPRQLEQVFANLIGNAIKYRRPEVPLDIRIAAEPTDGMWEFSVADNGIGIEAEYFDRIFEMFRRLHTHDQYEGTGIGLAVVKRIVERHGGRIRVESTPGEGSVFFFTLPAA